jgi:hypothetical protein
LHSKTPRLRSDCTPKQQDCARIALQNTTIALRLHSHAKQQDCAQIALPCQATRLRSDCTPKQQDCAQIALPNTGTAIRKAPVWLGARSALKAQGFRTVPLDDVPFPVLLSTLIRSRFQAKPATLLIPIDFSFSFRGRGALRYSVPKWLLFLT